MRFLIKQAARYPWSVAKAYYSGVSFDPTGQDAAPHGHTFKTDGIKMYISGVATDKIYQYSLSTAWDLSTATYDSVSFSLAQDSTPWGIIIKDDGMRMFIAGIDNTSVYEYAIGTAWDISTASYVGSRVIVSSQDSQPAGLTFKSDGARLYVTGGTNDKIYQYTC